MSRRLPVVVKNEISWAQFRSLNPDDNMVGMEGIFVLLIIYVIVAIIIGFIQWLISDAEW